MPHPVTAQLCVGWLLPDAVLWYFSKLGFGDTPLRERFSRITRARPALARAAFSRSPLENERLRARPPANGLTCDFFRFLRRPHSALRAPCCSVFCGWPARRWHSEDKGGTQPPVLHSIRCLCEEIMLRPSAAVRQHAGAQRSLLHASHHRRICGPSGAGNASAAPV